MEVTIEKLRKINGHDSIPKPKKTLSASDLNLHTLSIAAPEVPAVADVADDASERFSDFDDYFTEDDSDVVLVAEEKKPVVVEEEQEEEVRHLDLAVKDWGLEPYTVHVDGHRILTLVTCYNKVAARWIKQVLRGCGKKNGKIIVGVYVDIAHPRFEKKGLRETNYDLIQLCVGSQCLIYYLPEPDEVRDGIFPFPKLFANPHVITAGVNMTAVSKKLFKDHEIRFSNVMDLNEFPKKVLENGYELDLKRYDVNKLATVVLGKDWSIERPNKKKEEWFDYPNYQWYCYGDLSMKKVKFATYDAYTSFMIATKLLEMKSEKMSAGRKSNKRRGDNHNYP